MAVSTGSGEDEVMSTINITPFTDVLLVLLIIFIILASVTKEPKMPDAKNTEKVQGFADRRARRRQEQNSNRLADQTDIGGAAAAFKTLADQTNHVYTSVIIKADPKASYGVILQVMDAAKQVNLTNFGLANHIEGSKS